MNRIQLRVPQKEIRMDISEHILKSEFYANYFRETMKRFKNAKNSKKVQINKARKGR